MAVVFLVPIEFIEKYPEYHFYCRIQPISFVMEYLFILFTFLAGGGIVAGTTLLSQNLDPRYGGILAVAPIITTLSFIFTRFGTSEKSTQDLALYSLYFLIPTVLFLASVYLLMNRYSVFPSLVVSFGIWLVAVLVLMRSLGMG
ncbi:MAG: GlpM family protein [Methanoregulaceae archaeon]